jgi:L-arginine dehydrogenase
MRLAASAHRWSPKSIAGDLAELVTGRAILPSYDRPVFFRSIGLGLEDIAMAHALFELIEQAASRTPDQPSANSSPLKSRSLT